jgi:hypothetical protein
MRGIGLRRPPAPPVQRRRLRCRWATAGWRRRRAATCSRCTCRWTAPTRWSSAGSRRGPTPRSSRPAAPARRCRAWSSTGRAAAGGWWRAACGQCGQDPDPAAQWCPAVPSDARQATPPRSRPAAGLMPPPAPPPPPLPSPLGPTQAHLHHVRRLPVLHSWGLPLRPAAQRHAAGPVPRLHLLLQLRRPRPGHEPGVLVHCAAAGACVRAPFPAGPGPPWPQPAPAHPSQAAARRLRCQLVRQTRAGRRAQVGPQGLPLRLGIVGDLGQTADSAATIAHLATGKPDLFVLPGDFSYADGVQDRWAGQTCAVQSRGAASGQPPGGASKGRRACRGRACRSRPHAPGPSPSPAPRWDSWGRLIEPLAATTVMMGCPGNHEIEDFLPPSRVGPASARRPEPEPWRLGRLGCWLQAGTGGAGRC